MSDSSAEEALEAQALAERAETEAMNARITAIEEAIANYGNHIRLLNDGVSALQTAFSQTAESFSQPPTPPATAQDNQELIESVLTARSSFSIKNRSSLSEEIPERTNIKSFEEQLAETRSWGYGSYDEWFKLLEPNLVSYIEDPEAGVSVEENKVANWFRQFVTPYAQGNVADIGCGICDMPVYLKDFDARLVTGMDPIAPYFDREFDFYHGLAETLPWKDNSLDNVIVATSMDHFLDPRKSLEEIKRVLKPSGYLILWMGFIEGTKPYDPNKGGQKPVDDYHMFHFAQDWFEPLLEEQFSISERLAVNTVSTFYSAQIK